MFLNDYVTFWHLAWTTLYWIARFLNDYVGLWHSSKVMSHWIWLTMIRHDWPWWHWMTMVYCIWLCLIFLNYDWLWLKMMAMFDHHRNFAMVMLIETFFIGYVGCYFQLGLVICENSTLLNGYVTVWHSLRVMPHCNDP